MWTIISKNGTGAGGQAISSRVNQISKPSLNSEIIYFTLMSLRKVWIGINDSNVIEKSFCWKRIHIQLLYKLVH